MPIGFEPNTSTQLQNSTATHPDTIYPSHLQPAQYIPLKQQHGTCYSSHTTLVRTPRDTSPFRASRPVPKPHARTPRTRAPCNQRAPPLVLVSHAVGGCPYNKDLLGNGM